MQRRDLIAGALAWTSAAMLPTYAQGKPIRILVGFPPGGSSDVLARVLAEGLRDKLDGPVLAENRAGAAGRVAVEILKSSPADGTTLLVTPNVAVTLYPHTYKRLGYDAERDVKPVARLATFPQLIGVGPKVPTSVRTVKDLITWFKANPNLAFYGSSAQGSTPHFVGQMLGKAAGVHLSHVSYKGDAPAVQDLIGGQIAMSVNPPAAQMPHVGSGRLRVLAVSGPERMKHLPDVPTLAESGYPIQTTDWFGVLAPSAMPAATTQKVESAIKAAMATAAVREGIEKLFLTQDYLPAAQLAKDIRSESAHWAPIVKESGFLLDD